MLLPEFKKDNLRVTDAFMRIDDISKDERTQEAPDLLVIGLPGLSTVTGLNAFLASRLRGPVSSDV